MIFWTPLFWREPGLTRFLDKEVLVDEDQEDLSYLRARQILSSAKVVFARCSILQL